MVALINYELPESVLTDLQTWLSAGKTLDRVFNEQEEQELNILCQNLIQEYQSVIRRMDYPDAEILTSKPGLCHGPLHSGFLLMGQDSATPIHDHGNCFSLSLVLQGRVKFVFFKEIIENDTTVKIHKENSIELEQNQFSYLPAKPGLLHKLTAVSKHACMLDILYRTSDPDTERYWYLPVTRVADDSVYCQKMAESEFTTISRGKFPEIQPLED